MLEKVQYETTSASDHDFSVSSENGKEFILEAIVNRFICLYNPKKQLL